MAKHGGEFEREINLSESFKLFFTEMRTKHREKLYMCFGGVFFKNTMILTNSNDNITFSFSNENLVKIDNRHT